jgi:hypothetical protein
MKLLTQKWLWESIGYTALVAVVAALGYFTLRLFHRQEPLMDLPSPPGTLIELQNFQVRRLATTGGAQLQISIQIRTTAARPLPVQLLFVAKPAQGHGKEFGVWPTLDPSGVVTAGGHFRGGLSSPAAQLTLTRNWARVNGTIPEPGGGPRYRTVVVYVVGEHGDTLLSRPFLIEPG